MGELFKCQYVSLHVPLTAQTKESISKALMMEMPKGAALINTARAEVIHEDDMLEVLKARPDFCYLCDVAPKKAKEMTEAVGDAFGKRVIFTKKKMGAQTLEANNNAGVAAANQIVSFFEKGDVKFQVNKPSAPAAPKEAKTVLLATEKAFAAEAVNKIEKALKDANYTLKKLENYKTADELHAAAADVDAMIIRSD